jgi:hypothetical protein
MDFRDDGLVCACFLTWSSNNFCVIILLSFDTVVMFSTLFWFQLALILGCNAFESLCMIWVQVISVRLVWLPGKRKIESHKISWFSICLFLRFSFDMEVFWFPRCAKAEPELAFLSFKYYRPNSKKATGNFVDTCHGWQFWINSALPLSVKTCLHIFNTTARELYPIIAACCFKFIGGTWFLHVGNILSFHCRMIQPSVVRFIYINDYIYKGIYIYI